MSISDASAYDEPAVDIRDEGAEARFSKVCGLPTCWDELLSRRNGPNGEKSLRQIEHTIFFIL